MTVNTMKENQLKVSSSIKRFIGILGMTKSLSRFFAIAFPIGEQGHYVSS